MSSFVYEGGRVNERKDAVGPGWADILDQLDAELYALNPDYKTVQVKEKFGLLRVYLSDTTEAEQQILYKYEEMSSKICEKCGQPGKARQGGWLRTLCGPCELKYKARKRAGLLPYMEF
jgi:hypothetical protein